MHKISPMAHASRSSLRRFRDYRRKLRQRAQRGDLKHEYGTMDGRVKSNKRSRAFYPLFKAFVGLLHPRGLPEARFTTAVFQVVQLELQIVGR